MSECPEDVKSVDSYKVEIFFRKNSSEENTLDEVPELTDYDTNTVVESFNLNSDDSIYEHVTSLHPNAAYIHVIEFQRRI